MHVGEQYSGGLMAVPGSSSLQEQAQDAAKPDRPSMGRWPAAAILITCCIALFVLLLRISFSFPLNSDAANNALQAWDMLHGNVLLHGWIIGDATYYVSELPLYVITDALFGLGNIVPHVVSALVYVLVAISAVALARAGTRGMSAAVRSGVVLAMMSAPLLLPQAISILIEKPDHTGTAAITFVSILLVDRFAARRFTPPLLCAILIAGQLSDATVLYVTVPAIIAVTAYRMAAARKIRTADGATVVAALLSVPLEMLLHSLLVRLGGFLMIPPVTKVAPYGRWSTNFHFTTHGLQLLFGALTRPEAVLGGWGAVLGYAGILAAVFGFGRVIWTWRTASRAEQMLCVVIVINIAAYVFSTIPMASNPRELVAVLPAGAILAARGLVRGPIAAKRRAQAALAAVAAAALLPLVAAAAQPQATPPAVPLAAWLEAHGLTYGIGGYWNASAVTLVSGGRVRVRAITGRYRGLVAKDWETNWTWYYPRAHDATFAIANPGTTETRNVITVAEFEKFLGKPVSMHMVFGEIVMIYNKNVLFDVAPALPLPPPPGSGRHHKYQLRQPVG